MNSQYVDQTGKIETRFKIGDLVRCWYFYYNYNHYYGYYPHGQVDDEVTLYGVVVEIDYAYWDDQGDHETIYVVYCTDGVRRFFAENEMDKIS